MITDDYSQGIGVADLVDAPNARVLAQNLANALASRSVLRFASASARAAALVGAAAPVEGMVSWLQDTNALAVYDGAAWAALLVGGATVVNQQSSSYDATITSYGTAASSGTYAHCEVAFVAPSSGKVRISVQARFISSTSTSGCLVAPETRTGATLGGGTVVEGPSDINGASHYGDTFARLGVSHILTGLTPGASYNTRMLHRASANTATFALRELNVEPVA
ncbi:hypothetical protein [Streptomyces antibioticus]|uniref:hypothetical protein n=1 Tax=Streptomyces antibioticus TaxID=1890 RepID=UPI0036F9BE67